MLKGINVIKRKWLVLVMAFAMVMAMITGCGKAPSANQGNQAPETAVLETESAGDVGALDESQLQTDVVEIQTGDQDDQADTTADEDEQGAADNNEAVETDADDVEADGGLSVTEDGTYSSKEEVAAYLIAFGHLPDNYLTKKEAQALGWDSSKGNLWDVAPGMSIGGDRFGNYEGLLPEASGRKYSECDIDYNGGRRNAKRIVFSNDGLVYYTEDHYESFECLTD